MNSKKVLRRKVQERERQTERMKNAALVFVLEHVNRFILNWRRSPHIIHSYYYTSSEFENCLDLLEIPF
jgi:hypothetical protein